MTRAGDIEFEYCFRQINNINKKIEYLSFIHNKSPMQIGLVEVMRLKKDQFEDLKKSDLTRFVRTNLSRTEPQIISKNQVFLRYRSFNPPRYDNDEVCCIIFYCLGKYYIAEGRRNDDMDTDRLVRWCINHPY